MSAFRTEAAKRTNGARLLRQLLGLTRAQWQYLHDSAISLSYSPDGIEYADYVSNFLDLLELNQ